MGNGIVGNLSSFGYAPLRKVRVKDDMYPWMTDEVRRLARARNYYRKKFIKTRNQCDWECFKNLRKKVKELKVSQVLYRFVMMLHINPGKCGEKLTKRLAVVTMEEYQ